MPTRTCPSCQASTPRHLEASSKNAFVNYYNCPSCGHVWTIHKNDPSRLTHITPLQPAAGESGPVKVTPATFETRQGDILIRDRVADFCVWQVARAGSTDTDPSAPLFTADRRAEALEAALKLAATTGGRVFSIDRAGVWTDVTPGTRR